MKRLVLVLVVVAAVALPIFSKDKPVFNAAKLVDLTYAFDDKTIYWPTAKAFAWEKEAWGQAPGGYFYSAARYAASEHGGTHFDSPIHFSESGYSVDAVPLAALVAPAVVIDISAQCTKNPEYLLSVADVDGFEKKHGVIAAGAVVLVRTGWGQFWPDKKKYLGDDKPGDASGLRFPGIAPEAAKLLVARKVAGVGIDTASIDHGQSKDFLTHRILYGANIYGLENVANLERLPARGATLIALPMKIKGGTGAPVRIVAVLP